VQFRKGKKRILVADDDEDFLSAMRAVLEFGGFRVDTAEDGEKALKEIKRHGYDLLILDVVMPRIDGVKLFQMVKKSKRYRDIPVLFVSGYPVMNELEERKREIVKKAEAYIQKPFKTKEFLEMARRLLEK
jgi:CheY-like chemotaxis protein